MESSGRFTLQLRRLVNTSYNQCRSCSAIIAHEQPAFAGYSLDGTPLYVGECCKPSVHELASHIYWFWESDKRVPGGTVLWRYMDFSALVALLEHRTLHFARADQFADPFEAAAGARRLKPKWDKHHLAYFRSALSNLPDGTSVPEDQIEGQSEQLLQSMSAAFETLRQRSFVSCWHADPGESEALWRLYCPPPSAGVAIRTTAEKLLRALGYAPVKIGKVVYLDFAREFSGTYERIFSKRKSLKHEAEVRLVLEDGVSARDVGQSVGQSVPVDVSVLLEAIVPSPFAPRWFGDVLQATLKRYDVDASPRPSEILDEPFF